MVSMLVKYPSLRNVLKANLFNYLNLQSHTTIWMLVSAPFQDISCYTLQGQVLRKWKGHKKPCFNKAVIIHQRFSFSQVFLRQSYYFLGGNYSNNKHRALQQFKGVCLICPFFQIPLICFIYIWLWPGGYTVMENVHFFLKNGGGLGTEIGSGLLLRSNVMVKCGSPDQTLYAGDLWNLSIH